MTQGTHFISFSASQVNPVVPACLDSRLEQEQSEHTLLRLEVNKNYLLKN